MRAWFTVIILVYYSCINNKLCLTKLTNNYLLYILYIIILYVLYANKLALSANDEEKFKNVVSHLDNSPLYLCNYQKIYKNFNIYFNLIKNSSIVIIIHFPYFLRQLHFIFSYIRFVI